MSTVGYVHLGGEISPPAIPAKPFKAMLVVELPTNDRWREEIAEWLVRSGCLYLVAWGEACEAWHDSVDDTNVRRFDGAAIPDDKLVMTTWNEHDALGEAMWFAANAAEHPTVDLKSTVIVHVSALERGDELMDLYRLALD